MSRLEIASVESWYEIVTKNDDVTLIHEPWIKPFYRCNMWHIRGRDRDLLVDSGMGVVPLRKHIPFLTGRPILAVASHAHFDHIGCHHEFEDRAIHTAEADILANPENALTLADVYATSNIFTKLPPGWRDGAYQVQPAQATKLLAEGDILDLGDRVLSVMHLPGHSPGGIALWESATQILFAGDTVYDGPLIDDVYHSDLDAYVASMERLRLLPVRVVHGGHFSSFDGDTHRRLIDTFLADKRPH